MSRAETLKWCSVCGMSPRDLKSYRPSRCVGCRKTTTRRSNLASKYGLSPADFDAMLEAHGYACAICRETPETGPKVDHSHTSGAVRGILCMACNTGLGQFKDDPALLRAAAAYLERAAQTKKR